MTYFKYPGWTVDAHAQQRLKEKVVERIQTRQRFMEAFGGR